jgi:hypothetical protein
MRYQYLTGRGPDADLAYSRPCNGFLRLQRMVKLFYSQRRFGSPSHVTLLLRALLCAERVIGNDYAVIAPSVRGPDHARILVPQHYPVVGTETARIRVFPSPRVRTASASEAVVCRSTGPLLSQLLLLTATVYYSPRNGATIARV